MDENPFVGLINDFENSLKVIIFLELIKPLKF